MKHSVIYVHGKGGSAVEAEHYRQIFSDIEVTGFDYRAETPWDAVTEFTQFFTEQRKSCDSLTLIANSIGAFFSIISLNKSLVNFAYFISPIVNMEKLILNMMHQAHITEHELAERSEIKTNFGETLSWRYLCYVREHSVFWNVPTDILYGENDILTLPETISHFAKQTHAELTVMPNGEHWFHTEEQMRFLDNWIKNAEKAKRTLHI